MKKEDLKKHCKEEKPGLLKRKIFNGSLIIFLLYQSGAAQIPINGFCKYSASSVKENYNRLFALNFNQDSYSDLLLTGGTKSSVETIAGEGTENFSDSHASTFSPELSNFITYLEKSDKSPKFAFLSRKQKKAGWLTVSAFGTISVASQISFTSFPAIIGQADLDADGKVELLISGAAFNGISILHDNGGKIREKKLSPGTAFSQAVTIDLNNDSYPDIAAFNINDNSLQFFYNNSRGEFRLTRTLPLQNSISLLTAIDFNSDSYTDLSFICGNELTIIFGDSVAGYHKIENIKTSIKPDKFIWGDFNRDGKFDLAFLNLHASLISVLFQKNDNTFYDEIPYLQKAGLIDLIPFYSKFVYGFAALSSNISNSKAAGNIYFISNLSSFGETSDLLFGKAPSTLKLFDVGKDGISDLCLYNADERVCTFILRGIDGIPATLYSVKTNGNYSQLLIDDRDKTKKGIYFYNLDEQVIEFLLIDFTSFSFKRDYLYVDGGIKDCRLMKSSSDARATVIVVHATDDNLFYSSFTYKDFRYSLANASLKTGKLLDAKIDAKGDIYYWAKSQGEVDLSFASFKNPVVVKTIHTVKYDSLFKFKNYLADIYSVGEEFIFAAVSNHQSDYFFIGNSTFHKVLRQSAIAKVFLSDDIQINYFGKYAHDGVKRFILHSTVGNNFLTAGISKNSGIFNLQKITDAQYVGSYTVDKFSANHYYLLYTNTAENCVSIKKL